MGKKAHYMYNDISPANWDNKVQSDHIRAIIYQKTCIFILFLYENWAFKMPYGVDNYQPYLIYMYKKFWKSGPFNPARVQRPHVTESSSDIQNFGGHIFIFVVEQRGKIKLNALHDQ